MFSVSIVPPSIVDQDVSDKNITVIIDAKLVIDCPVTGTPLPAIAWFKDTEPLSSGSDSSIIISNRGQRLEIPKTRLSDSAIYRCVGTNDAGNTTHDFNVDIHGKNEP